MTTLIVTPIKLSDPGSYRDRKRFLRLLKRLRQLSTTNDADTAVQVLDEADELICRHLRTDDGSPVEDALDQLSANQFDQLLSALAFEGGVGEASTAPSNDGAGATAKSTPTG